MLGGGRGVGGGRGGGGLVDELAACLTFRCRRASGGVWKAGFCGGRGEACCAISGAEVGIGMGWVRWNGERRCGRWVACVLLKRAARKRLLRGTRKGKQIKTLRENYISGQRLLMPSFDTNKAIVTQGDNDSGYDTPCCSP